MRAFKDHPNSLVQRSLGRVNIITSQKKHAKSECFFDINYPSGGQSENPNLHAEAEKIISDALEKIRENAPNHNIKYLPTSHDVFKKHKFTIRPK